MDASITVTEFPINSSNASALAKKRWDAWREEKNAAKMLKLNPPTKVEPEPAKQSSELPVNPLHATITEQIKQIDLAMADCKPRELASLAQAKATLWKLLFPQPKAGRRSQESSRVEPVEPGV